MRLAAIIIPVVLAVSHAQACRLTEAAFSLRQLEGAMELFKTDDLYKGHVLLGLKLQENGWIRISSKDPKTGACQYTTVIVNLKSDCSIRAMPTAGVEKCEE